MLSTYFGQYSALYLTPEQQEEMGRTYGTDLVIPSVVYRHQHLQQQQQQQQQQNLHDQQQHNLLLHHEYQQHFLQHQLLLQQNQQQQQQFLNQESANTAPPTKATTNKTTQQSKKYERSNSKKSTRTELSNDVAANQSSSEIKFSIQRILSDDVSCKKEFPPTEQVIDDEGDDEEDEDETTVADDVNETMRYDWLQCTRYKPPKLQRARKKESCKKRKLGRNPRVPFTQHQVSALERKFRRTHYLSSMDVAELSSTLNLTETRVKIWFQNRRARERRSNNARNEVRVAYEGHDSGGEGRDPRMLLSPPCSSYASLVFPRQAMSPELGTKAPIDRFSPQRPSAFTHMRKLGQTGNDQCI